MKPLKKLLTAVILNSIDPKGIGCDGASPNLALCVPEKEAVGDHLVFMWCLSHKLELALKDAFRDKELDKKAQEQLSSEFYLFKKCNFKMAILQEIRQNNWPRSTSLQVRQKYQMGNIN